MQIFGFAVDHFYWQEVFKLHLRFTFRQITVRCYPLTDNTAQRRNMISWL